MTTTTGFVSRSILIGAGATLTMDLWAAVLRGFGVPSLDFALLGRWIGHVPKGRFIHPSIARSSAVRGELLIGWSAHYSIGMTVVAPLLVLQPALGAGIASSRTGRPVFNSVKSLVTHTVFGFGLFLAVASLVPAAS
jgi:hypothetical protein